MATVISDIRNCIGHTVRDFSLDNDKRTRRIDLYFENGSIVQIGVMCEDEDTVVNYLETTRKPVSNTVVTNPFVILRDALRYIPGDPYRKIVEDAIETLENQFEALKIAAAIKDGGL